LRRDENTVKVAVIILSMNQREKTLRCLKSFRDVTEPHYKIVLWDNGSKDETCDAVCQLYPDVVIHQHPENIGVASGRNGAADLAIEHFAPSFLLFIDNDMTVRSDFLEPLVTPFESDAQLAQTTGKILDLNDNHRIYGAGGCRIRFWCGDTMHVGYSEIDRGQYDEPKRCYPSGGCMLIRTDTFKKLGGFDPVFNPYGPEDLDFGLRAEKAGYYGLYVPESVVYHETKPGHTFEGGEYTEIAAYTRARHWLLLLNRHAYFPQKLGFYMFGAPYLAIRVFIREGKKGNIGALRGLLHGVLDSNKSSLPD
jgi:hypothetical protein